MCLRDCSRSLENTEKNVVKERTKLRAKAPQRGQGKKLKRFTTEDTENTEKNVVKEQTKLRAKAPQRGQGKKLKRFTGEIVEKNKLNERTKLKSQAVFAARFFPLCSLCLCGECPSSFYLIDLSLW